VKYIKRFLKTHSHLYGVPMLRVKGFESIAFASPALGDGASAPDVLTRKGICSIREQDRPYPYIQSQEYDPWHSNRERRVETVADEEKQKNAGSDALDTTQRRN
jgi:hypothetical protein